MEDDAPRTVVRLEGARLLGVASAYYAGVIANLKEGVRRAAQAAGAEIEFLDAPGALEIPAAISLVQDAMDHGRIAGFDGYVALGCVIRGETSHYDYVCGESARGLTDLALRRGLAIGNGVLTTENLAQAEARADPAGRDKGGEATNACLAMAALKRRLIAGGL